MDQSCGMNGKALTYITKVISDTTYDLAMPDQLKEFSSPVAACLTSTELMYDITFQREEEDEAMPAVHKRVSTDTDEK